MRLHLRALPHAPQVFERPHIFGPGHISRGFRGPLRRLHARLLHSLSVLRVDDDIARKAILLEEEGLLSTLLGVPPRRRALLHLVLEVKTQVELTQLFVFLDCRNNLSNVPALFRSGTNLVAELVLCCMHLLSAVRIRKRLPT